MAHIYTMSARRVPAEFLLTVTGREVGGIGMGCVGGRQRERGKEGREAYIYNSFFISMEHLFSLTKS